MLDAAVQAWCTAITARKTWQSCDEDRLDEGFNVLMATVKQWPTPAQYLEAIPRRESMPTYQGHKAPALAGPEKQNPTHGISHDGDRITAGPVAEEHIKRLSELLRVDLSKPRDEDMRDYRQDIERPWGVDLEDWEP